MSGFSGRKAPNVSQYLANLNQIPSEQELEMHEEEFHSNDMNLFTNVEFFDIDSSNFDIPGLEDMSQPAAFDKASARNHTLPTASSASSETFVKPGFQFPDFQLGPGYDIKSGQGVPLTAQTSSGSTSPTATSPSSRAFAPQSGDKRKVDYMTDPSGAMEEASRLAAEEDKRRRNTAASARFRVKKKQREQALEKTAKEMTDKVGVLEERLQQLEKENKWLKDLLMEKNDKSDAMKEGNDSAWKLEERKDGVGTASS